LIGKWFFVPLSLSFSVLNFFLFLFVCHVYSIFQIGERAFSDGQLGFNSNPLNDTGDDDDGNDHDVQDDATVPLHESERNPFVEYGDEGDEEEEHVSSSATTRAATSPKPPKIQRMNFADFIFFHLSFVHFTNHCNPTTPAVGVANRVANHTHTNAAGNSNGPTSTHKTHGHNKVSPSILASLRYWFRCLDVDDKGYLTMTEIEYWYEQQAMRYFTPIEMKTGSNDAIISNLPSKPPSFSLPRSTQNTSSSTDDGSWSDSDSDSDSDDEEIFIIEQDTIEKTIIDKDSCLLPMKKLMKVVPNVSVESYLQQFLHFLHPHAHRHRYFGHEDIHHYKHQQHASQYHHATWKDEKITLDDLVHHNAGKFCVFVFFCLQFTHLSMFFFR
jgi:hypothetical protein